MGQWKTTLLRAGSFRLDGGSMFGVVPRTLWSRLISPDSDNCIPLQTNCLLLERDGTKVLIETGNGSKWSDKENRIFGLENRSIINALDEVGIKAEQIDLIILTHLHFDHAGGLTHLNENAAPELTFPSAEIVVQHREWQDAIANRSTMTATYLPSHLEPAAPHMRCIEGRTDILEGIQAIPTPGHTWGHQSILIDDLEGPLCFLGDLMPTRHHVGRSWSMGYDMLPYETMQTKQALLPRAADESWRVVLDHESQDPLHRIERDPEKDWFQLIPCSSSEETAHSG